jgi:hypothetical protein
MGNAIPSMSSGKNHAYFKCVDGEDGIKVVRDTAKEARWRAYSESRNRGMDKKRLLQNHDFEEVIIE